MRILFLGYPNSPLLTYLQSRGEAVQTMEPLSEERLRMVNPDWVVSYRYRHLIEKKSLDLYPNRFINLHIAYLPWNRGADPNLWSWIENTPKGVTIHHIDAGVDTGDIIAQREVEFTGEETLGESYDWLQGEIQALFYEVWPTIVAGTAPRQTQVGLGSYHRAADRERVAHLLTAGNDTTVKNLVRG